MNPQLNKVFSKLAKEDKKTELKSEKVELALADDIAKALKASEDVLDGSERSVNFAEKVAKDRNALLKDLPKLLKESNSVFDKGAKFLSNAEKAAKDLGLNTKDIKNYSKLESNLDKLAREIDRIINASKSLK